MSGEYRTVILTLGLVAASWGVATPSAGWSEETHRAVAEAARSRLSPPVAAEVERLLGGASMAEAAVWADSARDQPDWEWTWRLHFINVPDGAFELDLDRDCPALGCDSAPPGGPARCCVVGALEHYLEILADPRRDDASRATALRFVLHFTADLHQPLHVSRASDRGGNEIELRFFGEPMDLHDVWDRAILRRREAELWAAPGWRSRASRISAGIPSAPNPAWTDGGPPEWAQESLTLALEVAYDVGPEPILLGESYQSRARPVVEDRLRRASVRLAELLERTLGSR